MFNLPLDPRLYGLMGQDASQPMPPMMPPQQTMLGSGLFGMMPQQGGGGLPMEAGFNPSSVLAQPNPADESGAYEGGFQPSGVVPGAAGLPDQGAGAGGAGKGIGDHFADLLNNPLFHAGLGLMAGARTTNPILTAAQYLNAWQQGNQAQQNALAKQKLAEKAQAANETYQTGELANASRHAAVAEAGVPLKEREVATGETNARTGAALKDLQGQELGLKMQQQAADLEWQNKMDPLILQQMNGGGGVSVPGSVTQSGAGVAARPSDNNVGNLRPVGATQGFRQFDTPEAGWAALKGDLAAKGAKGYNTVDSIISRYAPPSENNTGAYIQDVAAKLGVKPGDPLDMTNPATISGLATAIASHEKGPSLLKAGMGNSGEAPANGGAMMNQAQVNNVALATALRSRNPQALATVAQNMQSKPVPSGSVMQGPNGTFSEAPMSSSDQRKEARDIETHNVEIPQKQAQTRQTLAATGKTGVETSAEQQKATNEKAADMARFTDISAQMDRLAQASSELAAHKGLYAVEGGLGKSGLGEKLPGQPAAAYSKLNEIKSGLALGVTNALKSDSPNGSTGFGRITNTEFGTMPNSITAVVPGLPSGETAKRLNDVVKYTQGAKQRMETHLRSQYGDEAVDTALKSAKSDSTQPGMPNQGGAAAPGGVMTPDQYREYRKQQNANR